MRQDGAVFSDSRQMEAEPCDTALHSDGDEPAEFLPEKHGHEVLGKDALALLQGYESGGDCDAFLSGLPYYRCLLQSWKAL